MPSRAEKQGTAMTLFGVAALIGAGRRARRSAAGLRTTIPGGGSFYINVPVGLLAAGCLLRHSPRSGLPHRPQRAELRKQPFRFDTIGLSLLVIVMVCWEVMLSKGQEWDWLGDPFWRVQTLATLLRCGAGRADLLGTAPSQSGG